MLSRLGSRGRRAALALLGSTGLLGCGSTDHDPSAPNRAGSDAGVMLSGGGSGGELSLGGSAGQAGSGGGCQRDVSLSAVTLGEPQPFDLVIVADHSDSLAWSRTELSAGLHDLLDHVRGRSVRVFVLTPTQYGASSAAAVRPVSGDSVVAWQDPATGLAYENAATIYEQSCTDGAGSPIDCPSPTGSVPYHVQGTWRFAMPDPIALLRPDMTDAEFDAEREAVKDKILALGGSGSPHEQPLCTLARYISQAPALLPKNAVFLLITDEDDVSLAKDCAGTFMGQLDVTQNENGTTPCSGASCDAYRYKMTGESASKGFNFSCQAFDDFGAPIAGSEQTGYASQGSQPSCDGITPGTCTSDESHLLEIFCQAGRTMVSCTRECTTTPATCQLDLHDPSVDPCTQSFSYQANTFANLGAYCAKQGSGWQGCSGGGVNIQYSPSISGGGGPLGLVPSASTAADLGAYFKTQAASKFAAGASLVEAIVLDPAFSCQLGAGQSYAQTIADFVGDRSHLFPLCESYAPALDQVLGFAQALIQTEFALKLASDEHVTGVIVIGKDGSQRPLDGHDYAFDGATGTLSVERSALTGTDSTLSVEVTSDCRPIVK